MRRHAGHGGDLDAITAARNDDGYNVLPCRRLAPDNDAVAARNSLGAFDRARRIGGASGAADIPPRQGDGTRLSKRMKG